MLLHGFNIYIQALQKNLGAFLLSAQSFFQSLLCMAWEFGLEFGRFMKLILCLAEKSPVFSDDRPSYQGLPQRIFEGVRPVRSRGSTFQRPPLENRDQIGLPPSKPEQRRILLPGPAIRTKPSRNWTRSGHEAISTAHQIDRHEQYDERSHSAKHCV